MSNKENDLSVTVYSPESQMRSPVKLLKSMFHDLKESRELAWRLFVRDTSARYRQSVLGILWAFLPPLLSGMVFIILQSRSVLNLGKTDIPYPLFVLVGTTLWQVFTESVNAPLKAVQSAKAMLAKINFPREALILSAFYDILFSLAIKSVILAAVLIYFKVTVSAGMLLALPAILMLILLGMAIGLLLTPIGMLYTDVGSALTVFIQFWFFVTPVVYPPPTSFPFNLIVKMNPVSPLLVGARDLLTLGTLKTPEMFLLVSGFSLVGMFFAWVLYRLALPIIIERMSS